MNGIGDPQRWANSSITWGYNQKVVLREEETGT